MEESSYTGLPTSHLLGSVPVSEQLSFFFLFYFNLCYLYAITASIHSLHARSCSENCSHFLFSIGIKLIVRKFSEMK